MPFKFTGTLQSVRIKLGEEKLTPKEKAELQRRQKQRGLAAQ